MNEIEFPLINTIILYDKFKFRWYMTNTDFY